MSLAALAPTNDLPSCFRLHGGLVNAFLCMSVALANVELLEGNTVPRLSVECTVDQSVDVSEGALATAGATGGL